MLATQAGHGSAVRASFLATYGLDATRFPLLRLDTRNSAPFEEAL